MEQELNSCATRAGLIGAALLVVTVAAMIFIPMMQADLERAAAERDHARASVINATSNREHQQAVDFQHNFMLWTAYLETANAPRSAGIGLTIGLLTALLLPASIAALAGGYAVGQRIPLPNEKTPSREDPNSAPS